MLIFIIFIDRIKYKYYKEFLIMSKYYSINEFSKILGVSAQTLRNWDNNGKLHLVQIITVFSCKLQGKRANKARKLVNELIEDEEENIDKNNSSNVTAKQQTED